jgi:DNA-binding transcriptional LysR family regulator
LWRCAQPAFHAARRPLPERRDEWKGHSVIGFADLTSNVGLARWSDVITRQGTVVQRCSSRAEMLVAAKAGLGISALSCFAAAGDPDLVGSFSQIEWNAACSMSVLPR